MKKIKVMRCLSSVLILLLGIGLVPCASALDNVYQPTTSSWYKDAMNYCMDTRLFDGIPKELIIPDAQVTWAMAAQILANRTENYHAEYYQTPLEDEQNNPWYKTALKWMTEIGLVDNSPSPESPISREEVVNLLYEYAHKTENATVYDTTNGNTGFTDFADVSKTAKSAVKWAKEYGIVHGYEDSSFRPSQPILVSEMAQILFNGKNLLKNNEIRVLFSYSAVDIEKIEFQNGNTGKFVSYTSRADINDIVEHLNAFRFDKIKSASSGWTYAIRIWPKQESAMRQVTVAPSSVCVGVTRYISSEHEYFPQEWLKQYCP